VTFTGSLMRGRVYAAELQHIEGQKYFLVVSNNRRNAALVQVLAVRLTTSPKPAIPSIVELGPSEVFAGRAVCDDITELYRDEVRRDLGALTPGAMAAVDSGLRAALSLQETGR
jgi:mRNA interferase MazF